VDRDEIRRLLAEADGAQRSAVGPWRDTLLRLFARGDGSPAERAAVLGVPGRRQVLRLGGTAVLGAAVLAACGSDEETPPAETGVTQPAPAETTIGPPQTTSPEDGVASDIIVARTAVSLELTAVALYDVVLGEGESDLALPGEIDFDIEVIAAATLFRDHHSTHADVLSDLVSELGGDPVTEPNRAIVEGIIAPELAQLTSQRAALMFARSVEDIAASTYGFAASVLSTADGRQTIMGIGGVEARHSAALALLLDPTGLDAVPVAFLDVSGPARTPDEVFVQDDQDGGDVTGESPEGGGGQGEDRGEAEGGSEGGEGDEAQDPEGDPAGGDASGNESG